MLYRVKPKIIAAKTGTTVKTKNRIRKGSEKHIETRYFFKPLEKLFLDFIHKPFFPPVFLFC